MLTPEQIADGWIAHDGGECPVPLDSRVSILLASGFPQSGWIAGKVVWPHDAFIAEIGEAIPADACVIAYKPEGNPHE